MTIIFHVSCKIILSCILRLLSNYYNFSYVLLVEERIEGEFWSLTTNSEWPILVLNRSRDPLRNRNLMGLEESWTHYTLCRFFFHFWFYWNVIGIYPFSLSLNRNVMFSTRQIFISKACSERPHGSLYIYVIIYSTEIYLVSSICQAVPEQELRFVMKGG